MEIGIKTDTSTKDTLRDEYKNQFVELFNAAASKDTFEYICTLVRVGGMQDAGWDPAFEITKALEDFSQVATQALSDGELEKYFRIAILTYCHALEMSANQHTIANLIRIASGSHYSIDPFFDLHTRDKKTSMVKRTAGLSAKMKFLHDSAQKAGFSKLSQTLKDTFNPSLRNCFSHSDYTMTSGKFRGLGHGGFEADYQGLFDLLQNYFAYFEAYLGVYNAFKQKQRYLHYYKMPNYESLELLFYRKLLVGFKVHFSNGSTSHFQRTEEGVDAVNLSFRRDGGIELMVGMISDLEKKWKIDGKEVQDWSKINSGAKDND